MALPHESIVFSADEAGIYPLTADVAGSAATYGSLILLPGIQSVALAGDVLNKELVGDGVVIDVATKVRKVTGTVTFAKNQLDVNAMMMGGTVTDAGTTPNQIASYSLAQANFPSYFKLRWRSKQVSFTTTNLSDIIRTCFKCRVTGVNLGSASEEYAVPSFDFVGVYLNGTATINGVSTAKPCYDDQERETAAALS